MPPEQHHTTPAPDHTASELPAPHSPSAFANSTKSSRSLAIALIVSAVFLLAAVGIALWLLVFHKPAATVINQPSDDAAGVKSATLVLSADFPATYAKTDQSTLSGANIYYYDPATNCGITTGSLTVSTTKSDKDTVTGAVATTETSGVTTTNVTDGSNLSLKDADGKHTYSFNTVSLAQSVDVPGIVYKQQNNVIAYKQFGNQIVTVAYACKADTWTATKDSLAALVNKMTVKTER